LEFSFYVTGDVHHAKTISLFIVYLKLVFSQVSGEPILGLESKHIFGAIVSQSSGSITYEFP
jgi:hypothetical protein